MNQIIEWLAIGDLRSDGQANEVAAMVLAQPVIFPDLMQALTHENDAVRGHAADALEKISREMPELLIPQMQHLIRMARTETVPMVRWHLAMAFGNLAQNPTLAETIIPLLIDMLGDESAFVKTWCISGLVIWGRKYPEWQTGIIEELSPLTRDASIAVRYRAEKAILLLMKPRLPMPAGWMKCKKI